MRNFLLAFIASIVVTLLAGNDARAAICPTTSSTNTDCSLIITIGAGGAVSYSAVAGAAPYDGSDDALIGVVNNSGSVFTGSFTLTATGNGGGAFAFDGDGICAYTSAAYCRTKTYGYEGPLNTFTNISSNQASGTVSFAGLGIDIGQTTFFSLESSPASILSNGGIGIPSTGGTSVPEPATLALLGAAIAALGVTRQRIRQ